MELTLGISKIWDRQREGFPGGPVVKKKKKKKTHQKNPPASAGDVCSIPGLEISPEEGNGNPPPYACLENSVDKGA